MSTPDPAANPHIAFNQECELVNASWSLDAGRTVEFRITGHAYERIHPFKRFQQRRGGRMGTRFQSAIARVMVSDGERTAQLVYRGDAMLAAWGDSSAVGQHFKLWLDDEADRHPFAGYERRKNGTPGELFHVVLVELDEDEKPIDQTRRARIEGPAAPSPGDSGDAGAADGNRSRALVPQGRGTGGGGGYKGGIRKLSSQAHMMVTSPMFVRYLRETKPKVCEWTAALAKVYVKQQLHIESLSELDTRSDKATEFHSLIRKPYARWNEQEP